MNLPCYVPVCTYNSAYMSVCVCVCVCVYICMWVGGEERLPMVEILKQINMVLSVCIKESLLLVLDRQTIPH